MSDNKKRIREKTQLRRKYNSIVDHMASIPDTAKEHMKHKPYTYEVKKSDGDNH